MQRNQCQNGSKIKVDVKIDCEIDCEVDCELDCDLDCESSSAFTNHEDLPGAPETSEGARPAPDVFARQ